MHRLAAGRVIKTHLLHYLMCLPTSWGRLGEACHKMCLLFKEVFKGENKHFLFKESFSQLAMEWEREAQRGARQGTREGIAMHMTWEQCGLFGVRRREREELGAVRTKHSKTEPWNITMSSITPYAKNKLIIIEESHCAILGQVWAGCWSGAAVSV